MSDREAIVVAARRTPIGRAGGMFRNQPVESLAAPVIRAVLADAGIAAGDVDEVILGNAAGPGGNPARVSALAAGLPVEVPGVTVDRQCGSGLEAIVLAARLIEAGAAEVVVAGGTESASTAPWRLERPQSPTGVPRAYARARFAPASIGDPEMGVAAETVAREAGIGRERQDAYALNSHRKAVAAEAAGRFAAEIVPLTVGDRAAPLARDECPRPDTSLAKLAALPPAFVAGGTVTAGNCCPVNDGAAAVVLVSAKRFEAAGMMRGLRLVNAATAGCDPNRLGLGPVPAVRRLLACARLGIDAINRVEFNEAFAAQVLACLDALSIPERKVCVDGGAIALGHPFGASGAILVVRLFSQLVREAGDLRAPPRTGLATLGIGGGMGIAALFERVA